VNLSAVISLLRQALTYIVAMAYQLSGIYGYVQAIRQAQYIEQTHAQTTAIVADVENPSYGLAAIQSDITNLSTLVSQIATDYQQRTQPVVLPSTPPPGYGGASTSDIANAIWFWRGGNTGPMYVWNSWAGQVALYWMKYYGIKLESQPWLRLYYDNLTDVRAAGGAAPYAPLDWRTILPSDATPSDWVQRQYPSYGWQPWFNAEDGTVYYQDPENVGYQWVLAMDLGTFTLLKSLLYPSATATAPVWPGLANVTLGASQQLAMGVTVPGPLDGVLIAITGVPSWKGYFTFDDVRSYRNVGAVTFVTDNGDEEMPQTLGFQTAVYTPKSMVRASGAKLRTETGVQGTVTPWLRSV
jgi:hypothetical protein